MSERNMLSITLIRITCPSQRVASDIADAAIDQRLAACANIEGPMTSTYRWKGVVEQAFEFVLWLKAPAANFAKICVPIVCKKLSWHMTGNMTGAGVRRC